MMYEHIVDLENVWWLGDYSEWLHEDGNIEGKYEWDETGRDMEYEDCMGIRFELEEDKVKFILKFMGE